MKFERVLTSNWENAIYGLRNPMDSWAKSDSKFGLLNFNLEDTDLDDVLYNWIQSIEKQQGSELLPDDYKAIEEELYNFLYKNGIIKRDCNFFEYAYLGPNDLDLAQRMIAGGRPNDKFLRQIFVSVDITAPLYWWKEMDTYKIGTVANSTSTMHTLSKKPITLDCFETDDYNKDIGVGLWPEASGEEYVPEPDYNKLVGKFSLYEDKYDRESVLLHDVINGYMNFLERLRQIYLETKDIKYWKELIRWLPESWLQTRTWTANYDVLRNIYHWRKNHKLIEWRIFCDWIVTLPYADELILYKNK